MERSRAAYFTQKELNIILESFEQYRDIITTKGNTAAANKAREECWKKIADRVNSCGTCSVQRTWQQIKTKHKNILQSANRREKYEKRKIAGGPALVDVTDSEEPAPSPSRECPITEGTQGDVTSVTGAGGSQQNVYVQVVGDTMVLLESPPAHTHIDPQTKEDINDEATHSGLTGEEGVQYSPQRVASTSTSPETQKVGTDTVTALYKRNLELDNIKKELEIKKLKLEIEQLEKQRHSIFSNE
ncbi:uncharacterized protein LOC117507375 [Thalassophryne amazonica]|uniref:uncharacterized protein LOC117507375 n=1 Tax=Thalassophryne amazonica TaxID=390379 RepID=UPI00147180EC|nr:uncharacterized protein LOC117507375 [Thalassophryne amazonica]